MKLSNAEIEDLTGKSFKIIVSNGKDGILQSKLWKELELTSRDGSRVAIRLEKRSLIKRERILKNGRWTYKLFALKLPIDTQNMEQAPCLTCPVEHMCSVDAFYSPNNCNLIEDWVLISFNTSSHQEHQQMMHNVEEHELIIRESESSLTKNQSRRMVQGDKKK